MRTYYTIIPIFSLGGRFIRFQLLKLACLTIRLLLEEPHSQPATAIHTILSIQSRGFAQGDPPARIRHDPLRDSSSILVAKARATRERAGGRKRAEGAEGNSPRLKLSPRPESRDVYEWKFADCEMDLRQGDAGTDQEF